MVENEEMTEQVTDEFTEQVDVVLEETLGYVPNPDAQDEETLEDSEDFLLGQEQEKPVEEEPVQTDKPDGDDKTEKPVEPEPKDESEDEPDTTNFSKSEQAMYARMKKEKGRRIEAESRMEEHTRSSASRIDKLQDTVNQMLLNSNSANKTETQQEVLVDPLADLEPEDFISPVQLKAHYEYRDKLSKQVAETERVEKSRELKEQEGQHLKVIDEEGAEFFGSQWPSTVTGEAFAKLKADPAAYQQALNVRSHAVAARNIFNYCKGLTVETSESGSDVEIQKALETVPQKTVTKPDGNTLDLPRSRKTSGALKPITAELSDQLIQAMQDNPDSAEDILSKLNPVLRSNGYQPLGI